MATRARWPRPLMTAAGPLLLAVISSVLWLTRGFDPAPSACSALASGVLYGSFSLKDLFPTISSGCSWTLENPDPTKYSLYLRFNREDPAPTRRSPEQQQQQQQQDEEEDEEAELELCEGSGPFTFLHFDKNFVQLCLAAEPEAAPRLLEPQALEFRFVEVLLINNNNSSQFTCSVLCRWLEECLQAPGARRCGFTHAGCSCQAESPPVPRRNGTRPPGIPGMDESCLTAVPIPTADSKWGPWNHWSLCSKTCDTGWQRRFRMCEGTGVQGYPCEGTGEEVKTCNEKEVPRYGDSASWCPQSSGDPTCRPNPILACHGSAQPLSTCAAEPPGVGLLGCAQLRPLHLPTVRILASS
uniref:Adhesion G protein-coupled receptor B N-terminal domain-containing protein n=1 Tax=Malurus cyaneus samueli TaxID=2593467 RepID=A0A8C5THX8_9PASS